MISLLILLSVTATAAAADGRILTDKAEGNFTEVHTADGRTFLHQLPMGKIMEDPPHGHIRVHRSYAVNTARIKTLRSAAGSKYWLELDNAEDIPVSRFRVADIRNLLSS